MYCNIKKNNIKVINLTHYTNLLEAAKRNHILDEKEYETMKAIYEEKEERGER